MPGGSIRAAREMAGRTIGAYDLLIAGPALGREMTPVTAKVREFRLFREDWVRG